MRNAPKRMADPEAPHSPIGDDPPPLITPGLRLLNAVAVIVPFLTFLAAALWLWGWGFDGVQLGLMLGM